MRVLAIACVCCALVGAESARAAPWDNLLSLPEAAAPEKPDTGSSSGLDTATIAGGLKDALRLAAERTVQRVGAEGGYADDPAIRIPLPKSLRRVQQSLDRVGLGGLGDDLAARINRAAEQAAPAAGDVLVESAMSMRLTDARAILTGPEDAATRYFERTASKELRAAVRPIIDRQLSNAGAVQVFQRMLTAYDKIPFVSGVKTDLTSYTTQRALDGIFHYMAKEEAAIRANPAARTTALVKRIFGR